MDMNVRVAPRTYPSISEHRLEFPLICSYTDVVMDDCPYLYSLHLPARI